MRASDRWRAGVDPYFLGALAVGLLAAALQSYRIGAPLSGYHGYNESYYFTFALKDAARGFLGPVLAPQDVNNPFLFPLLLATVLRVFGPSIAAARAISIAASFATVLLTYWTGRQLYNRQIGLLASVMIAASAGLLLTGRNVQLDPLMLMLEVAAVGAYLRAVVDDDAGWSIASGALFGLGLLTKLPIFLAVVSLALWQLWRTRSWTWVKKRSTWLTALAAGVAAVPWYLYNTFGTSGFAGAQSGLLERTGRWQGVGYLWTNVLTEQFWMLTPVVTVLAIAGVVVMARKRADADKLILVLVAVHAVVFLWNSKHSYYFTPLLPWMSLAAARALWTVGVRQPKRVAVAAVIVAALVLPFSIAALSAKKWSMLRIDEVSQMLPASGYAPVTTQLLGSQDVLGALGPAVDYYLGLGGYPAATAATGSTPPPGESRRTVLLGGPARPMSEAREIGKIPLELVSPVLFGWAIRPYPGNVNYYSLTMPEFEHVGPAWAFGTDAKRLPERVVVLWALPATNRGSAEQGQ